jgi:hypothetical protein
VKHGGGRLGWWIGKGRVGRSTPESTLGLAPVPRAAAPWGAGQVSAAETCNSLWIGEGLGPVERACLKSVVRQGHRLVLWCYRIPAGVPHGVEVRDASAILPADRILYHRGGSAALFASWFRYELQRRALGMWLDCDVYLLAPLDGLGGNVFGWENGERINTAVLRLPPDSPVLAPLVSLFDEREVPPWLPLRARAAAWLRLRRHGRSGLALMPWGAAGPLALTWLLRREGLDRLAFPSSHFYPMPWQCADWILDPRIALDQVIAPETRAIHLWNELIKGFKAAPAPARSFLARLQAEGAAD